MQTREEKLEKKRQYYLTNKEKHSKAAHDYYLENSEKLKQYAKQYRDKKRIENKDEINEYYRKYYQKNIEKRRIQSRKNKKKYYQANVDKCRKYRKEYVIKNKDIVNQKSKIYNKEKYNNNVEFKIKLNLRTRINAVLKGNNKSKSTLELLGCSLDFFKQHIESQFTKGMTWENHNMFGWHIDHIIPCAKFDLSDSKQQKICFHYRNMQPMWAKDNLSKGGKIIEGQNQLKIAI